MNYLLKSHSRAILEPLAIVISPYAPHAEELWSILGHKVRLHWFLFSFEAKHLVESEKEYPFPSTENAFYYYFAFGFKEQIEEIVMKDERTLKQLEGKPQIKLLLFLEK
jgi:leucyl-tRNA synthetase